MEKKRKTPLRKCVATQQSYPKKELVRIVRNKDGEFSIDPTGKQNGRGAYIKASIQAFEIAKKNKALEKSFKQKIDSEVYDLLLKEIEDNWDQ